MTHDAAAGPLAGLKVLELGGIGPGPFAAMFLADLGADVVRLDRPGDVPVFTGKPRENLLHRGKRSVMLDLKKLEDAGRARSLVAQSAVIIEGFRPGTTERLGFGPEDVWKLNPAIVYGRMTGWGPDGPLADVAGHDINYISVTGALHAIGPADGPPSIPLNLLGDFGGGGSYLVIGVLAALFEARATGRGQVVDAAIMDGAAHLLTSIFARVSNGVWVDRREANQLDGGAPYYAVYQTSDDRYMAVGAMEAKFYAQFISLLGIDEPLERQDDRSNWPSLKQRIAAIFRTRTQQEWIAIYYGTDACVSPVRTLGEAADDPQVADRKTILRNGSLVQPATAPRFPAYPQRVPGPAPDPGQHTEEVFRDWLA